ncbi:AAA family ATPase [Paenibacillus glycanilyticus]|uniref:AAA family ATPase n=1 Tax=Paenibacillus glycanilyticus TaxID=126569 RepID=UPI00204214EA|nr:AAA family ATPase [Paenibacillus glycanilyticus]MCM3626552.1 AAA family ATPase [Paenibacillus glycanilyticus]
MKLLEARIDGFGRLQGLNIRLDGPSVVLYGMNEAGKSTLFGFIRTILYGFARRNQPAERQEPVNGGTHGGQLVFEDEDGCSYIAERYASQNGGRLKLRRLGHAKLEHQAEEESWPTQEEWERTYLGGTSEQLFRELYAITLTELQQVGALSHDELGRYLYHAGWENGKAIAAAEKKLQQEMEQLFKPRGVNQQINKQLKTLEQTEQELRKQADAIQAYNELQQEMERIGLELGRLDAELPERQSAAQLAGKAHAIRPFWLRRLELDREQEGIADAGRITPEAEHQWHELQKERSSQSHEREQLEQERQLIRQKRLAIQVNEELLARKEEAEALLLESERMQLLREERLTLIAELQSDEEVLARLLGRIAPNWGEQQLLELQLTVSDREYVRGQRQLEVAAGRNIERLNADLHAASQQEREAAQLLAEAEVELAQAEAAASGRMAFSGAAFLPQTSEAMRAAWNSCDAALREWELERLQSGSAAQEEAGQGSAGPLWIGAALAGGAAVALGAASLGGGAFPGAAGAAAALGALALALAALAQARGRRAVRRGPRRTRGPAPAPAPAREQRVRAALAALVGAPAEAAAALLAEPPQAAAAREQLRAAAEARAIALQRSEQLGAGRLELARRHARLRAAAGERREAAAAAAEEHAAAVRQWRGWLEALALPDMSPDAALEVFELAEQALLRLQQRDRRAAKQAAAETQLAAFEIRAAELCAAFPDAAHRLPSEPTLALRLLQAELRRQAAAQEEAARLDERLQALHIASVAAQDKQLILASSMQTLLDGAGFKSESEFAAVLVHRSRLEEILLESSKLQIEITAGLSELRINELEQLLSTNDGDELERLFIDLKNKTKQLEQSKAELLDRRGRLRQQLDHLLQEEKHRELLAVKEMTIAQLAQDAERYAVLSVSASLIRATKRIYEEERQPALLKLASDYVRRLTEGRYIRVLTSPDQPSIRLEASDNRLVDSVMLSRGTAELIYLAMRLALAAERTAAAGLPLLLDDLFVNFDRRRLEAAAHLLGELTSTRQMILFTCHEHIRDVLQSHIPHALQIQLPGGSRQLVGHLSPNNQV